MDKKDVKEILNEIREFRNRELSQKKDNRVFYTIIMKLEKGENTKKDIYRIVEEYSVGENKSQIRELFYEMNENGPELIAKLEPELYEKILQVGEKNEQDWNLILEDIESGINKNREKIQEQASKLGIDEGLTEIENYKEIDKKIKEFNKDNKENDTEKQEDKPIEISVEDTKKMGIIGMNTISLNQKVGVHGQTLKSELDLHNKPEYKDVDEIEIIPAYKLANYGEKVPDVPFVPVGKNKNTGEAIIFAKKDLEIYKGENNEIDKIDGKDDSIKRQKSDCIFNVPGKSTSIAIEQKSPYGIVDASLVYNSRDNNGRFALDLQTKLEDGIYQQDIETREIMDPYQGINHIDEKIDEVNSHPKEELQNGELKKEDGDGNEQTKSHIHTDSQEFKEAVEKIMKEAKLSRENEVIESLLKRLEEDNKTLEEVVEEELEEQNERAQGKDLTN